MPRKKEMTFTFTVTTELTVSKDVLFNLMKHALLFAFETQSFAKGIVKEVTALRSILALEPLIELYLSQLEDRDLEDLAGQLLDDMPDRKFNQMSGIISAAVDRNYDELASSLHTATVVDFKKYFMRYHYDRMIALKSRIIEKTSAMRRAKEAKDLAEQLAEAKMLLKANGYHVVERDEGLVA